MTDQDEFNLEALIDSNGLLHVLTAIDLICIEKADYIKINWQDKVLARKWKSAARQIEKAYRAPAIQNLP